MPGRDNQASAEGVELETPTEGASDIDEYFLMHHGPGTAAGDVVLDILARDWTAGIEWFQSWDGSPAGDGGKASHGKDFS